MFLAESATRTRMGIFITLNNVDRFPGLTIRVKGMGDEIEISHERDQGNAVAPSSLEDTVSAEADTSFTTSSVAT